jgi:hypothetical protein
MLELCYLKEIRCKFFWGLTMQPLGFHAPFEERGREGEDTPRGLTESTPPPVPIPAPPTAKDTEKEKRKNLATISPLISEDLTSFTIGSRFAWLF